MINYRLKSNMDKSLIFTILGQVRGGKNSVKITRTGRRYPDLVFKAWRDVSVLEVRNKFKGKTIDTPVNVVIHYYPSDKRRRDVPAIIDGLWHVLEKAGVVNDDTLLGGHGKSVMFYNMGVDKVSPRVCVEIWD